ncbi:MAG: hypothetical protein ACOX9B_05950 [Candidatus Xenobium sp.]|jgi:hypothetical protein
MKIHSGAELYRLAQGAPAHKAQDIPSPKADDSGPVDSLERTSDSKSLLYKRGSESPDKGLLGKAPSAANVINQSLALTRSLKAFPGFIYPTVINASATEQSQIYDVLDALPLKDVNSVKSIKMVPEIPNNNPGWVTRGRAWDLNVTNYIELSRKELQDPADFRKVLIHEIGHTKDYESAWFNLAGEESSKKPFGEGPHISDYAKTNRYEDYAETYANYHVDPKRTQEEVPEKFEAIRKSEEPNFVERLVDRKEFRETGRWLGEHMGDNLATRNGVQIVHSLAGGVQAICGAEQLRQASQTRDPQHHYQGILNLTAGVLFSSGMLGIPGMAVHSAQRSLDRAVARGELSALDADAGVRTLSDPIEKAVRKAGSKVGLLEPFHPLKEDFPDAKPKRARALGVATGGALGGVAGSIAGPYGGVLAGYHLGGPVGGAVGLVVGALGGYALGTELGGRAGGALTKAFGG